MPTIFSHHTHTTDSNHAERTVRNHTNEIHQADYVSMVGAAPPNLDLIFTRTEHWEADPTRFDRLAERVSERDGTVSTFESHVVFSVAGSRGAVINGIETSLETDTSHVTVCGLPIDRRPPARVCSLNVLCDLGREAAWVAPAHPRFPKLGFSDARLRRFLDRVGDEQSDPAAAVSRVFELSGLAAEQRRRVAEVCASCGVLVTETDPLLVAGSLATLQDLSDQFDADSELASAFATAVTESR